MTTVAEVAAKNFDEAPMGIGRSLTSRRHPSGPDQRACRSCDGDTKVTGSCDIRGRGLRGDSGY